MTSNLSLPVNLRPRMIYNDPYYPEFKVKIEEIRDVKKFEKKLVKILQDILSAQINFVIPSPAIFTNYRYVDIKITGLYKYSISLIITHENVENITISYRKDYIKTNDKIIYTNISLVMERSYTLIRVNKFNHVYNYYTDVFGNELITSDDEGEINYKYYPLPEIDYLKLQLFIRFRNVLREKKILH